MWWRAPWLEQRWTLLSLALFDAAIIVGTYNVVFWHRFDRWAGVSGSVVAVAIIWLVTSYLLGRYSRSEYPSKKSIHTRAIASVITAGLVLLIVVSASWGARSDDPRTFRSFVIPVLSASYLVSSLAQEVASHKSTHQRKWKIIAKEAEQSVIQQELTSNPTNQPLEVRFASGADDALSKTDHTHYSKDGFAISEEVEVSDKTIEALLSYKSQGAAVCSLTTWCESHLQRIPPEVLSARWLAQAEGFNLQPGRLSWRVKRFCDLILGFSLLIASAPVTALAALAIVLEDRGPIFYSQIRSGLYGEQFRIWKLRTMRVNAESQGAQWSECGDKRITGVGHWLRQLRIDELPQLVCVIKGEMSLIGPRPERPCFEEILESEIPHYRIRHWVRPGLSGWAQVCLPYGASVEDSRAKLSYDLYYLRNASLALDSLILIKTIRLILNRRGAIAKKSKMRVRESTS